jgi:hypothetical protein
LGVRPKVSKLLRRHLSGETEGKEDVEAPIMRDLVPEWERRILCTVERPRAAQISKKMQSARESVITEFRWFAGQKGRGGYGSPSARLFLEGGLRGLRTTRIDPSPWQIGRSPPPF